MVQISIARHGRLSLIALQPLFALAFALALSACRQEPRCSEATPEFALGRATYQLPARYSPKIFAASLDRRERVRSGVRSVTYCRTSSKKIVAQSVSLDGEGLQKLIEERPTLAGVKQLAWNVETSGLPVPSGQTPTDDGGFRRYQAKDAYYLFEAAPADSSARMGARCATPSTGAPVLCRLYRPVPGKYALQIDLAIDQVPPARWAHLALEAERFLDSQKP